jgi:hypothetical protein
VCALSMALLVIFNNHFNTFLSPSPYAHNSDTMSFIRLLYFIVTEEGFFRCLRHFYNRTARSNITIGRNSVKDVDEYNLLPYKFHIIASMDQMDTFYFTAKAKKNLF